MVGLLDIAPAGVKLAVGDVTLNVSGLSITQLRDLIQRFPDVAGLFASGLNAKVLFEAGPGVAAAVIAYSCGNGGDEKAEAVAAGMVAGIQAEILTAAIELTMPKGPKVFLTLLGAAGLDTSGILSAARLPQPSKASSATATALPTL